MGGAAHTLDCAMALVAGRHLALRHVSRATPLTRCPLVPTAAVPTRLACRWTVQGRAFHHPAASTLLMRSFALQSPHPSSGRRFSSYVDESGDHCGSGGGLGAVQFSAQQARLRDEERELLVELFGALKAAGADGDDLALVQQGLVHLDEPFVAMVCGEFSSGKSTLLNALLGDRLLKDGVTPTTDKIGLIVHDSLESEPALARGYERDTDLVRLPIPWLNNIQLVDTPGTNAVLREHERLTSSLVPRADVLMFVASCDRALSESERTFLQRIWKWRKKVVVVLNKRDLLRSESDEKEVMDFVSQEITKILGSPPPMFLLSARNALERKVEPAAEHADEGAFGEFERYVSKQLAGSDQIAIKLRSPLGTATKLAEQYSATVGSRATLLEADERLLTLVEEDSARFQEEMLRDINVQVSRVDRLLADMVDAVDDFLDDRVRLVNIRRLATGQQFADDFVAHVAGDVSSDVQSAVGDIAGWFKGKAAFHREQVVRTVIDRSSKHADEIVGTVGRTFSSDREVLLRGLSDKASGIITAYNPQAESRRLRDQLRDAVVQVTAVSASAVGLGSLVAFSALDVTGLAGAGVLAVGGLAILPARKRQFKTRFRKNIMVIRDGLRQSLEKRLADELQDELNSIQQAISPYSQFVRRESDKLQSQRDELDQLQMRIRELLSRMP